jgi:hypothetical protein
MADIFDTSQSSLEFGESLLADAKRRSRKRQKKANIAGYTALALNVADTVLQRRANKKLKDLEANNTLEMASAVANYKQASKFGSNFIDKISAAGYDTSDIRENGAVHQYFANKLLPSLYTSAGYRSYGSKDLSDGSIPEELRQEAYNRSKESLRAYQNNYAKYSGYFDEGIIVDQATIEDPYKRIIKDATQRITSPQNTSIVRKIVDKIRGAEDIKDSLYEVELGGSKVLVTQETYNTWNNRIQNNTDIATRRDKLIADAASKYNMSQLEIKKDILNYDESQFNKYNPNLRTRITQKTFIKTDGTALDTDDIRMSNGELRIDYSKVSRDEIKINGDYFVSLIEDNDIVLPKGVDGTAMGKEEMSQLLGGLRGDEVEIFENTLAFNMAIIKQKQDNPMFFEYSDDVFKEAFVTTMSQILTFTGAKDDKSTPEIDESQRNVVISEGFFGKTKPFPNFKISPYYINDGKGNIITPSDDPEEDKKIIDEAAKKNQERKEKKKITVVESDPMLLFNDFKEQHEKGEINPDNYPKYLKMIEPNQEAYDMIIEFVKENGLSSSKQIQKEEKVIVRRGQEIPVESNTKLSDEERKQLRRAFLGPLDRAGVKMQVDRLKAYYEDPERNLTMFNRAKKALGLEGKSEAKIREFIKQAEDNDFNI